MASSQEINSDNMKSTSKNYRAVVIGTSAGGFRALGKILVQIDENFGLPIIIVQHLYPESDNFLAKTLDSQCKLPVKEANEKEPIHRGTVYLAPANYHLLVEKNYTFSLTVDPKVNYCRPSIDVLFETAADVYGPDLIGVLLTGANSDGAVGLRKIKSRGGVTIVQDPDTAEVAIMPKSAIKLFKVDYILPLQDIFPLIRQIT